MASTTELSARAERELHDIAAEARFLSELAAVWETESDENRAAFALEWSNLMGGLVFLDEAAHSGRLSAEQAQRYARLRDGLQRVLPLIHRMGLYYPAFMSLTRDD